MASQHSRMFETKQFDLGYPQQDVDESTSDVITVNMPLHHEVIQFDWLSCKYSKRGSKNTTKDSSNEGPGTVVVR